MDNAVTGLMDAAVSPELAKAQTGIDGLDEITGGGLPRDRVIHAAADRWVLTFYVNGGSPNSIRAIDSVRRLCDEELDGHVDLEIIDVRQHPALVVSNQILAAPTLVKRVPGPLRRIVGDMSDTARRRLGLESRAARRRRRTTGSGRVRR